MNVFNSPLVETNEMTYKYHPFYESHWETPYHRNKRLREQEARRIRRWMIVDLFLFAVCVGLAFYIFTDVAIASSFRAH